MVGSEEEHSQEEILNPEWRQLMQEGVLGALDNYELFDRLVPASPENYTGDRRPFPELTAEEQQFIKGILFDAVGFDPARPEVVAEYELDAHEGAAWTGRLKATVYKTARSEEDMFLHKRVTEDGKEDWFVAPADYRL